MKKWLRSWEMVLFIILMLENVVFGIIDPNAIKPEVLISGMSDFIYIAILALPFLLIIILGDIDLSFSFQIGLYSILLGVLWKVGVPLPLACILVLCSSILIGLFNALLINKTGVNALVMTLATGFLYSGLAVVLSGSIGANGYDGIAGFPDAFVNFANLDFLTLTTPLWLFLGLSAIFIFLTHFSNFGRLVKLAGQNAKACQYIGVSVPNLRMVIFGLMSLTAAIVAILLVSYYGSARSDFGNDLLMPVITSAVLGGASIYGGSGSTVATILAALIIGFLQQGLQMLGVPSQLTIVITGGLLVLIVGLRGVSVVIKERLALWKLS